jgi:uncharacterized glyoxalase superfamily protein PhnB
MEQRMSLITLGYGDFKRARDFYTALGWTIGWTDDSCVHDSGGWGGATLGFNTGSPEEVDEVLAQAEAAGATIGRPGAKTFWGGYSGLFIDPEGHPWEVAHNPNWTLHEDGSVTLN